VAQRLRERSNTMGGKAEKVFVQLVNSCYAVAPGPV
jgi:hypothetical protein